MLLAHVTGCLVDLVQQLVQQTGCPADRAQQVLHLCDGNFERARAQINAGPDTAGETRFALDSNQISTIKRASTKYTTHSCLTVEECRFKMSSGRSGLVMGSNLMGRAALVLMILKSRGRRGSYRKETTSA